MPALPFDQVRILESEGTRVLTAEEFMTMPLHKRIGWVLERRLSFFLRGAPVDPRDALAALRGAWSG